MNNFQQIAFSRNELFFGKQSNNLIQNVNVFVIGIGGVGSVICEQLIRLGVKSITFFARGHYDPGNINRQIPATYISTEVKTPKIYALSERLKAINPFCEINPIYCDVVKNTVLITDAIENQKPCLIFNCVDESYAQLIIADIANKYTIPMLIGGVTGIGGKGILTTFKPEDDLYKQFYGVMQDKSIKKDWLKDNKNDLDSEVYKSYILNEKLPYPVITPVPWLIASTMIIEFIKIILKKDYIFAPNFIEYDPMKNAIIIKDYNKSNVEEYNPWRP